MKQASPEDNRASRPLGRVTPLGIIGGVCGLMLIGLLLRIYRLDSESAWADECCYFWLKTGNAHLYWTFISFCGPDNLPLYYLMLYGWSRLFGISLIASRMMIVTFGMATIPLAFALARRAFSTRAGLLAAAWVAISPFQIWYAQSMRPYGVCVPLVLFSFYALMQARDGKRWGWPAALAMNVTLLWIHPFMALLLPVQALYLWGTRPRGFRAAVYWSFAQIPVVLPPYLWLRPRLANVTQPEFDHYVLPGLRKILIDAFGDDSTLFSLEFPIAPPAWTHHIPHFEIWLAVVCASLTGLLAVAALAGLPRAVRMWREGRGDLAALWGIAFVPLLALVVLSYGWRPCLEPHYTPYASVALGIIAMGTISAIPRPYLRLLLLMLAFGLMGIQTLVHVQSVTRTEWRASGRYIAAHQTPHDIVLVKGIMHWAWISFRANQDEQTIPVIPAHSVEAVVHKTAAFFSKPEHAADGSHVWAVIEMPFMDEATLERLFNQCLGTFGISGSYVYYPGMERILLCCFSRTGASPGTPKPAEECFSVALADYEAIADKLDLGKAGSEERRAALKALRQVVDIPLPLGDWQCALISLLLEESDEHALAESFARRAIAIAPRYAIGTLALGISLAGQGRIEAAVEAFDKAFVLDPALDKLYGNLIRSLYVTPDEAAASRAFSRLAETGFPLLALRRLFVLRFPNGVTADPGRTSEDPLLVEGLDNRAVAGEAAL